MDYIRARRRARATWREITEELRARGVAASVSNVSEVYKRAANRKKWPAGLEPSAQVNPETTTTTKEGTEPGESMFVTGKRRPRKAQEAAEAATKPQTHRSRLGAHLDYIRAQRRARASWRQIADSLAKMGVKVSFQAVADYHGRMAARDAQDAEAQTAEPLPFSQVADDANPFSTRRRNTPPPEADPFAGAGLD